MNRISISIAGAAALAMTAGAQAGLVNFELSPASQIVMVGDTVFIDIMIYSDDDAPQEFDAVDALFGWNIAFLNLIGHDNSSADASYLASGFMTDPDGINLDLADGDAIFTALVPPLVPTLAPSSPGQFHLTTLVFEATAATAGTTVQLLPSLGAFGETRVLLDGVPVTGDTAAFAQITILVPAPAGFALLAFPLCRARRRRNA